jgi:hypothetical protein
LTLAVGAPETLPLLARRSSSPVPRPLTPRAFTCRCGRPVFFQNSQCLGCQRPLGYDAERAQLLPLEPTGKLGLWRKAGPRRSRSYRRCANLDSPAACNWLIDFAELADAPENAATLCRCCRLTRMLPDLSVPDNGIYWQRIAQAQRRLVSALIGLKLPVRAKTVEDPLQGLAFDLLRAGPGEPPVVTGHADGVITIDVEEADDPTREQRRHSLREPYRTLLGHLRHETGHYYWQRLVAPAGAATPWLEPFRALFGDERQDYAAALRAHYEAGAPADWQARHVSAYASSHPWEDWAETWSHYLHLRDTLDTARSFGLDGETVELHYERFGPGALADPDAPDGQDFLALINAWMELAGVLNELSRSMGVADFYPFVLSVPAVRKLHLVHRVIGAPSDPTPTA